MVHVSDISWTRKINHPSEVLKKGEEVEAIVLEIDKENQRIALGSNNSARIPGNRLINSTKSVTSSRAISPNWPPSEPSLDLNTISMASSTSPRSVKNGSTKLKMSSVSARMSVPASSKSINPNAGSACLSKQPITHLNNCRPNRKSSIHSNQVKIWSHFSTLSTPSMKRFVQDPTWKKTRIDPIFSHPSFIFQF